jgi:hypothetical protein
MCCDNVTQHQLVRDFYNRSQVDAIIADNPGPQGEPGIQGEVGPQGIQGIPGVDGIDGVDGSPGSVLPVVDETPIVYKTGQPTFTFTLNADAFTAARIQILQNLAGTIPLLEPSQTWNGVQTMTSGNPFIMTSPSAIVNMGTAAGAPSIRFASRLALHKDGADTVAIGQGFLQVVAYSQLTVASTSTSVDTIFDELSLDHRTAGTPLIGFGTSTTVKLKSNATFGRLVSRHTYEWIEATDVSRKARAKWSVYDTAEREGVRIEASGTAAKIGFLGAAAIVRPTITGSRATGEALANLLTQLANLGLIIDGTTT